MSQSQFLRYKFTSSGSRFETKKYNLWVKTNPKVPKTTETLVENLLTRPLKTGFFPKRSGKRYLAERTKTKPSIPMD